MTTHIHNLRNRLAIVAIVGVALTLTGCDDRGRPPKTVTIPTIDVKRSSVKDVRDASTLSGVVAAANLLEPPSPAVPTIPGVPSGPGVPSVPGAPSVSGVTATEGSTRIAVNFSRPGMQVQFDGANIPGPPILRDKIAEVMNTSRTAGLQPAIRLNSIRSDKPYSTKEAALDDALNVARFSLMRQLQSLDAPINAKPSKVTMRNEYIKGTPREILPSEDERKLLIDSGLRGDLRWVEIDLELSEDQVQKLRASDRVTDGFRGAGAIFIFLVAIYGFLRLDEWTKGYLTTWLGVAAIVVTAAGILFFLS